MQSAGITLRGMRHSDRNAKSNADRKPVWTTSAETPSTSPMIDNGKVDHTRLAASAKGDVISTGDKDYATGGKERSQSFCHDCLASGVAIGRR